MTSSCHLVRRAEGFTVLYLGQVTTKQGWRFWILTSLFSPWSILSMETTKDGRASRPVRGSRRSVPFLNEQKNPKRLRWLIAHRDRRPRNSLHARRSWVSIWIDVALG